MHNESDPEGDVARALAALPADDARPYDWHEFQRRRARAVPARRVIGAGALAAAVLALAGVAVWVRVDQQRAANLMTAVTHADDAGGAPSWQATAAAGEPRAAERWLASLPGEPAIVRVGTRADVLGLEDHIAQVDDLLSAAGAGRAQAVHLIALQRQRARLVSSLEQVRYAETLADESR
jgi:hypothetical protein